ESKQPTITESNQVVAAIESILIEEAKKQSGDPGVIFPRRLSNSEYNRAIFDLTGVNIEPTKEFPADPAGGEGFDNTGEALRMSPNLLKKYLAAAQLVADHMVLKPNGVNFAPFPVRSYNERKKLTEQAVIDFYEGHAVEVDDYLEAAWRFRHRQDDGASIENFARERRLSPKYLSLIISYLSNPDGGTHWGRELGRLWDAIPAPANDTTRPDEFQRFAEFITLSQQLLGAPEPQLIKANAGNWPIAHLDFRDKVARSRDKFDASVFQQETLITSSPVPRPDPKTPATRSLYITFKPGFSDAPASGVIQGAVFSQSDRLPRNDEERTNQKVVSFQTFLRQSAPDLLAKLKFGIGVNGEVIDADAFSVTVPATIEIPLSPEQQNELQGRRLLLPCRLDSTGSPEGSVFVQTNWDAPPREDATTGITHLIAPQSETAKQLQVSAEKFCDTFPNRFFYVNDSRGLAAGFHLVEGFFRDDRPLVEKVLTDSELAELDQLWQELDFVTESTETMLRGFVWFERSEREVLHDERFDFLRSEDPKLVEEELLGKFERLYMDRLGIKRVGNTLEAENPDDKYLMVHQFFQNIRSGLVTQKQLLTRAEEVGLREVESLARRAWRRGLQQEEQASLEGLYHVLRSEGQNPEGALRGVLTAVLMSPHFCYYIPEVHDGTATYPLSDKDLASRLSLFLWSSLPDEELLATAEQHQLQSEEQLISQTRRMLKSPKINAFAEEFLGQWLRYRDYLAKDHINADAFPDYDDALREALAAEPVRLVTYLVNHDLPITELLSSDVTFVNRRLAAHYGGEIQRQYDTQWAAFAGDRSQPDDIWFQVSGLRNEGRGGLLGMGIILTKNSAGERTSPVKRGFWTVHHLLGQHFPPPPANVPELPKSEKEATQTIRQLLAIHVADSKCAMCHKHFDGLGLAMEGFDAIGRKRVADSAGRPVDSTAELPGGGTAQGIPELIDYIQKQRQDEFVKTFCRKFLGYALGRSVILSDEPLLEEMETSLKENGYRFSAAFETVVRSPQFRQHRGRDFVVGGN
ncbi:MAG: DUF1592 domain-containing protein, partial [Planctomycetaceae bacterium]|nr:DUF1592 domain-containing protein [Planctomycetaceae bacterium]